MNDKKRRKIKGGNVIQEATASHPEISPDRLVEEIRKRAHEISVERGGSPGDALGDWLRAEQEIKSKYGTQKAKV